jgi:quinol monooxygenase YgiN
MTALPAKRKEFLQTVQALIQPIRKLKGCLNCSACQDVEDENSFCMIQGWENKRALNKYLQSELFDVLLGTKNLMSEPWEISSNTVSSTSGINAIKKARRKTI